jgi:chemotaxis protein CheX
LTGQTATFRKYALLKPHLWAIFDQRSAIVRRVVASQADPGGLHSSYLTEQPMAVAEPNSLSPLVGADSRLVSSILDGVTPALVMCNLAARCVGISSLPCGESGRITGLIGVHGKVSGFITVSMPERCALKAVGGLLQETFHSLTPQVIDGVGEITNLIAGGIKASLASTSWAFPHITVPSVIVGDGYQIAYAKGLDFVSATFEHRDLDSLVLADRLLRVSVSLMAL